MPFTNALDFRVIGPYNRKLLANFTYIDRLGVKHTVPKDYVTDGASIPKFAWAFTGGPFSGLYLWGAVIHDYLCQMKLIPRKRADRIFLEAMKEKGVNWFKRWYMHRAVRGLSVMIKIKGFFFRPKK